MEAISGHRGQTENELPWLSGCAAWPTDLAEVRQDSFDGVRKNDKGPACQATLWQAQGAADLVAFCPSRHRAWPVDQWLGLLVAFWGPCGGFLEASWRFVGASGGLLDVFGGPRSGFGGNFGVAGPNGLFPLRAPS